MDIVVASNNKGKIKEIKDILVDYNVLSLNDVGVEIDVIEDMDTFEGNAMKKCMEIYDIVKMPVIADDSGFCILGLDNFPGVYSHRFLGDDKSDSDRNNALIEKCINLDDRSAKFVTVIAYYDGDNQFSCVGELKGVVSFSERGENGFAFDKILELTDGFTVAEHPINFKNKVSARKIALEEVNTKIKCL